MAMLLKEACDDSELSLICHRWSSDKFMFWARDWEDKKLQRVIREWQPEKIAEIFQHRLLRKSVLNSFLRTWNPPLALNVLAKCKSDVFVYRSLCTMYYTEKRITEDDIKSQLEEYEEDFAASVLSMFQSHEAAHFIKDWNDSYVAQVLSFVTDKSWVADAMAGRLELRAESSWGTYNFCSFSKHEYATFIRQHTHTHTHTYQVLCLTVRIFQTQRHSEKHLTRSMRTRVVSWMQMKFWHVSSQWVLIV